MVYAACFAAQTLLEQVPIFAQVVKQAGKAGLLLRAESRGKAGGQFGNVR